MTNLGKLVVLGAVLTASAPLMFASPVSPITLTGGLTVVGTDKTDDTFSPTSISFSSSVGSPVSNALITGASGNLMFAVGSSAVMTGFTSTTTNQTIFAANDPQGLIFELLNVAVWTDTYTPGLGTDLVIKGTGEFFDSIGDTPELGTFVLSTEDTTCTSTICGVPDDIGFSFTPSSSPSAPAPEPSTLLLLGSGLIGGAGMLLRKNRAIA